MSGIISSQLQFSSTTIYAVIRDSQTAYLWNGTSLVPFNSSNYATYVVPMAEQGTTGFYVAATPSGLPVGLYTYSVHQGTGIMGDTSVDNGILDWDGTAENYIGRLPIQVKSEVDDSLGTDVIPELSAVASATPTLKEAIMFLFMAFRNKRTSTSTAINVYDSSGTSIAAANQSDNGVIYNKDNFN